MKQKILFFYFLFFNLISLNSFNILFISQNYQDDSIFIDDCKNFIEEIINFNPICHYSEYMNFYYIIQKENISKNNDFYNFELSNEKFFKLIDKINIKANMAIIVINSKNRESMGGEIGKNNFPVIIITNHAKKRTILHELGHSLFKLGDEYDGEIKVLPSEYVIKNFKNLSLTKENPEWDNIKSLVGERDFSNYEGGLLRKKGVYRAYKNCLMRNIENDLCPVCFYYAVSILNSITDKNKDFRELLNNRCNIKNFKLEKVFMSS